jgi:hypothetical protein
MMLQVSAFDLEWQTGESNSFHSAEYEKECIRLLQARLQDPINSLCDQTICAVATMAAIEVSQQATNFQILLLTGAVWKKKNESGENAH